MPLRALQLAVEGMHSPLAEAVKMFVCAHVASMPRKRGERYLRALARLVEDGEQVRELFPTRPAHERIAKAGAQDAGAAFVREVMPDLVRSLAPP